MSTADDIKHWETRVSELETWLLNNSYEHKNYMQNQSDYNHATWKVAQIKDRMERDLNGPRNVGESYVMPRLKQYYNNH